MVPTSSTAVFCRFIALLSFVIVLTTCAVPSSAQTCPTPAVVANTTCTVTPGTTTTVTPANAIGLNSSGAAGAIIGNGITLNLAATGTTGALAQTGSNIVFDGSMVRSTSTVAASANNQIGLHANGATVSATGSTISLAPTNAAGTLFLASSFMVGALADNGGTLIFNNTAITTQALQNPPIGNNHALVVDGAGSIAQVNGGSLSTIGSRASFGAFASNGGAINLQGTEVLTSGPGTAAAQGSIGSHALYAMGAGSLINGTNIVVNTAATATLAMGARAEAGGEIDLVGSQVTTAGAGNVTFRAAALGAVDGGIARISGAGSTLTTTGNFAPGVLSQGAGSQAFATDTTVTVSGGSSNGVHVVTGGNATITNSTINNSSASAVYGVLSSDAGSLATLTNTIINATNNVQGALATLEGTIVLNGGTVTTSDPADTNRNRVGLWATKAGTLTANNTTVITQGNGGAHGVRADNLGTLITLNGGSVSTSGSIIGGATTEPPIGISARAGAEIISNGTTVSTLGRGGIGVASENSTITLSGNNVTTLGDLSEGLYATINTSSPTVVPSTLSGTDLSVQTFGAFSHGAFVNQKNSGLAALLTLDNSSVTAFGPSAAGLKADGMGTLIATNTIVQTAGTNGYGAEAADNGSSVTLNRSTVSTTGADAHGAMANRGGLVIGNNSTVQATGANAMALYVAGESTRVSSAIFTGSMLQNATGPIIGVGGVGNVSLTNSTVQRLAGNGTGDWLRVGTISDFPALLAPQAPPPVLLDLEGIIPPPPLDAPAPPLPVVPGFANVTMSGSTAIGSAFTAAGSVSNLTMTNNSLWTMTGDSNITNLTNSSSLIDYTAPVGGVFKTLTVANYVGASGTLGLNTFLGSDPSPSDKLVIDGGNASGNSLLRIKNAGGPGALTIANGILVVDTINAGTTNPGTFALAGPVVAGPYEYTLFRSSVDASNEQAWYLRSTLNCDLDPTNPICSGPVPPPNYRPETSLYAALPAMALLYGRTLLDTLHERVGEEEDLRNRQRVNGSASGAWARVIAQHGDQNGDPLGVFGSGPKFNYNVGAFQGGQDLIRRETADGSRDHAGLYGAVGLLTGDVTHFDGSRAGTNNLNAYTVGGYWTHFGPSGWYLDAILQGTWYDAKGISGRLPTLATNGWGIAGSLEAGYPIKLGGGLIIEPQAQIVYQAVRLDAGADTAATVQFRNADSFAARIGARIARTWTIGETKNPRLITAWIRPSVWNEFAGNPQTLFSSATGPIPFRSDIGGTWFELNAGVNAEINRETSLFANVGYQVATRGNSDAYNGKLGLRLAW